MEISSLVVRLPALPLSSRLIQPVLLSLLPQRSSHHICGVVWSGKERKRWRERCVYACVVQEGVQFSLLLTKSASALCETPSHLPRRHEKRSSDAHQCDQSRGKQVYSDMMKLYFHFITLGKGGPRFECGQMYCRRTKKDRRNQSQSHDMLFGLLDNILKHHMGGIFFNPVQFYLYRAASQQSTQGSQLCCRVNTLIIQGKPQKSEDAW